MKVQHLFNSFTRAWEAHPLLTAEERDDAAVAALKHALRAEWDFDWSKWERHPQTVIHAHIRKLVPNTVANGPVLKRVDHALRMSIDPTGYDFYEWTGHSDRTSRHVVEAMQRAIVFIETGAVYGRGPE